MDNKLEPIPEGDRFASSLKFRRLGTGGPDVLYECWGDAVRAYAAAAVAAERERCARVCDDEARIRTEAGDTWPEESPERSRCYAAARAAINCAKGVRGGEVV